MILLCGVVVGEGGVAGVCKVAEVFPTAVGDYRGAPAAFVFCEGDTLEAGARFSVSGISGVLRGGGEA